MASTKFINYYNEELLFLRNSGRFFAEEHPKVAGYLALTASESKDPHIERLIESFAFLSARLRLDLENRYPDIALKILDNLYPHLVQPLPSVAMVQFCPSQKQNLIDRPLHIPKGTSLFYRLNDGLTCEFQTCYNVTVPPFSMINCSFVATGHLNIVRSHEKKALPFYALKLDFEMYETVKNPLDLDEFLIHLAGPSNLMMSLYQALFSDSPTRVFTSVDDVVFYEEGVMMPVGFERDEDVIPSPPHVSHAYALLQEFFHCPEKFLYMKLAKLAPFFKRVTGTRFSLVLGVCGAEHIMDQDLTPSSFFLGVSPVRNLFHRVSDPLLVDYKRIFYRLVPDLRRDKTTEVHSIQKVYCVKHGQTKPTVIQSYFSFSPLARYESEDFLWISKRGLAEERQVPGSDVFLSFVDLKLDPFEIQEHIIYADVWCTNRFLADKLYVGNVLESDTPLSGLVPSLLTRPCRQVDATLEGDILWELISLLSINYLGVLEGERGLQQFEALVGLFATMCQKTRIRFDHIEKITINPITRRLGDFVWKGFVEGVELTFHTEEGESHISDFLLFSVLNVFFSLHVNLNSFVELVWSTKKGEKARWKPVFSSKKAL